MNKTSWVAADSLSNHQTDLHYIKQTVRSDTEETANKLWMTTFMLIHYFILLRFSGCSVSILLWKHTTFL